MIDVNDMRRRAQYCAERAANTTNPEMFPHWQHAADAWAYAARAVQKTSPIIDDWDRTKSSRVG